MDLAIRVNVRYAAPPNSHIKDALRLFKSPRWVQSIIRYIMPQLNSVSPASTSYVDGLKENLVATTDETACVVCMEAFHDELSVELPCRHAFHAHCIDPWLKLHSTCPTCRHQLPTDAYSNYSVYAINTTIILQQSQANMPTAQLLELPASNQVIRAVVNARVRRNPPSLTANGACCSDIASMPPVMNARIMQQASVHELDAVGEECTVTSPPAPTASRRRCRSVEPTNGPSAKRARLESAAREIASTV
ncbi:hypothetical protein SPRG_07565 [Saprolegnia parasitica CBS 223.65]|uniref:RING-type domain-containing protein n=1 Tax=Saprolegnia parasitica (strain CBS 223.65) TaxID=695850 RepID=A0A067CLA1_SAPPC|nr:hypothetical protein SPRG_07565 [Saprolegnia parasitica CBS 223.65]KDO27316.1 hypothetical protein SPRG_07565 [Saprolegnia parasitica CBS 223.65]|eukprot:XP_012202089.1 hypothetical protein SPRG_07565 [Saprolegnia parasitica CBS 223.65]